MRRKKDFSHWDWRRQWWQGLGRAPGFARFKVYCSGGEREHGRRRCRSLLLLPCLDYGCSRCKCVSEPLTNTNAGIKGQQQQSRHTRVGRHTHIHASHTHTHTRALPRARAHALEELAPESSVRTRCPQAFSARCWKENIDIWKHKENHTDGVELHPESCHFFSVRKNKNENK